MMFTIYKKLITPESSPILGPVVSTNITPRESPNIRPMEEDTLMKTNSLMKTDPLMEKKGSPQMEPFSLYDCCCSPRNKQPDQNQPQPQPHQSDQQQQPHTLQLHSEPEYEFGHATHYKYNATKYNATTPRLMCDFELD